MNLITVKCTRPLGELEYAYVAFAEECERLRQTIPAEVERFLAERGLDEESKQRILPVMSHQQSYNRWIIKLKDLPENATQLIIELDNEDKG